MLINRISMIEAGSIWPHLYKKFPIPRLGVVLLGTILKNHGFDVKIFVEDISEIDWSFVESSDLVGISTITSTAPRAYALADLIRKKGIPVIMGGIHPTFMPEEALQHADYVVKGEADLTFISLINYLRKGSPNINDIKGISFKDSLGKIHHNPIPDLIDNLDILPSPDFSLLKGFRSNNIYPISTSRGCPFDCKFCSVIQMFGRRYRFRSVEKTLIDIKMAIKSSNGIIFFVDDNFSAHKGRTKDILKGMIEEKIKARWSAQVRIDVAKDEELLRLMAESGCSTLYVGFESINPQTLKYYNKKQDLNDIVNSIKNIKSAGIHIHGMFVLGADTDDIETIKRTADFAITNGIDTVQFMILTPLPGTPFFFEMQDSGRLIHMDWSRYDGHHVVFKPKMNIEMLQIETIQAMKKFYSWKYIIKNFVNLNFYYALIGLYGKILINKTLKNIGEYLESIHSLSFEKTV